MPSLLNYQVPPGTPVIPTEKYLKTIPAKALTQNFFTVATTLSHQQNLLLIFLTLKAKNTNYIKLSTNFIRLFVLAHANSSIATKNLENVKINTSYSRVLKDITFLIDRRILLRIRPKTSHFVINPVYSYPKPAYRVVSESRKWAEEWANASKSGQISEDFCKRYAMSYFVAMHLAARKNSTVWQRGDKLPSTWANQEYTRKERIAEGKLFKWCVKELKSSNFQDVRPVSEDVKAG